MTERVGKGSQSNYATIEHLYPPGNDPTWVAWCCNQCNASHKKPLHEWFKTAYCIERGINERTVAPIIQRFLESGLKEADQLWLGGAEHKFLHTANWEELSAGVQFLRRSNLNARQVKAFDRVALAIRRRRDETQFGNLEIGTYGKYYGFMYWFDPNAIYRQPLDSATDAASIVSI